jgi:elongator complex protein 6
MTSRTTPPLLEPYLLGPHNDNANGNDAPTAALVLVTGVIGASTNWLVLRQLHSLLKPAPPPSSSSSSAATTTESSAENGSTPAPAAAAVVLVSFLRDYAFWRDSLARLGVDLEGAARRGRFGYVDGLGASLGVGSGQGQQQLSTGGGRNAPLAARPGGAGGAGGKGWMRTLTASSITSHGNEIGIGSAVTVMQDLSRVVGEVLELLRKGASSSGSGVDGNGEGKEKKVVLVIDGLDFLLAVAAPADSDSQSDSPPAVVVRDALMDLREVCLDSRAMAESNHTGNRR